MPKRRRTPGPSGPELQITYEVLQSLQNTGQFEELEPITEGGEEGTPDIAEMLEGVLETMKARLEGPKALSLSGLTSDNLSKLNIIKAGKLKLKPEDALEEQVEKVKAVGKNDVWSSANLYHHLQRLLTLVPNSNEVAARTWIDAFFFRVSAMVLPNERVVLITEQPTAVSPSSTTTLHGTVDYIATVADRSVVDVFLLDPTIGELKSTMPSGLVVTKAKSLSVPFREHIPQAIGEMYACAATLAKDVIRGVLTAGDKWIFLVLVMNPKGDGVKYWESDEIGILHTVGTRTHMTIASPWPDVMTGILAHWLKHSFEDIGSGDDWFKVT